MDERLTTVLIILVVCTCTTLPTNVVIHTDSVIHNVEPYYISYAMDAYLLGLKPKWLNFDFKSPKLHALMTELGPSILRFGGSPADWTVFESSINSEQVLNFTGIAPALTIFTKNDLDNMVKLTQITGNRFLFDLNLQFRYGQQWDPTNAYEMLKYMQQQGYGSNVDFELGNEPTYYTTAGEINISPELIGKDFVILERLIRSFPNLNSSNIVGPDVQNEGPQGQKVIFQVADKAGGLMKALTFHHYYFRGDIAHWSDYINPDHFNNLAAAITTMKNSFAKSSHPDMPLWIGETADSWHEGTPNVTDRYVSGFLWLDKLGLAASMGVSSVIRQTFYGHNYGLLDIYMNPNPDYWLSWVHKQLVGTQVLNVTYSTEHNTTRVYAHCTNVQRTKYPKGSVTVFGLNMHSWIEDTLKFDSSWSQQRADMYLITPPLGDRDGILSKFMSVNGEVLQVTNQTVFPTLSPVTVMVSGGLRLSPFSMAFSVFPQANLQACYKT